MLDELKDLLRNFFPRTVAYAIHAELVQLRQDVDRLIAKLEGSPTQPETHHGEEVKETEAHAEVLEHDA